MTHKGNNEIPNGHFHKKWQRRIKTWFDQPARKYRRRITRKKNALKVAPRPTSQLRPAIRCPTVRYQNKIRLGRGFTLEEVKRAGLNPSFCRTIGIAVDHRRFNKSVESLQTNVQRLKEYMSRLILFPHKNAKKVNKGEASVDEQSLASQVTAKKILPLKSTSVKLKVRSVTDAEKKFSAYAAIRKARIDKLLQGKRAKKLAKELENPDNFGKVKG